MAIIKNPVTVVQQGGSSEDYATVGWYDWTASVINAQGNSCNVQLTDATALATLFARGGLNPNNEYITLNYDVTNHLFQGSTPTGESFNTNVDQLDANGLTVTNIDESNYPSIDVEFGDISIDNSNTTTAKITPFECKQLSSTDSSFVQIGINAVPKTAISSFTFGTDYDESTIPMYFLKGCTSLNSEIIIPDSVTAIFYGFMEGCSSFNSPVTLPPNLTLISNNFMYGCSSMTNTIDVGNLPATVAKSNNNTFSTGSSSVDAYYYGMTIVGTYVSDWLTRFPNLTTSPFRKLIGGKKPVPANSLVKTDGTIISLSANDVPNLCNNSNYVTVNGTTIQKTDIYGVDISNTGVTSIGDSFLKDAEYLRVIKLPMSCLTIGGSFMYACSSFNQQLDLPTNLTSISNQFLGNCASFNQPLVLPSTLGSIGAGFMTFTKKMTSTIYVNSNVIPATGYPDTLTTNLSSNPAYVTGITISGSNAQAWKTRFPDLAGEGGDYRKLIV